MVGWYCTPIVVVCCAFIHACGTIDRYLTLICVLLKSDDDTFPAVAPTILGVAISRLCQQVAFAPGYVPAQERGLVLLSLLRYGRPNIRCGRYLIAYSMIVVSPKIVILNETVYMKNTLHAHHVAHFVNSRNSSLKLKDEYSYCITMVLYCGCIV